VAVLWTSLASGCNIVLRHGGGDVEGARMAWAFERMGGLGSGVVDWADYKAKVAMVAASEDNVGYRGDVGLDLFVQFLEGLAAGMSALRILSSGMSVGSTLT
jgi:hypothetical protein